MGGKNVFFVVFLFRKVFVKSSGLGSGRIPSHGAISLGSAGTRDFVFQKFFLCAILKKIFLSSRNLGRAKPNCMWVV
jgi:hypothetical protein